MNDQTTLEQTIIRQAAELTQARTKISTLEEAHEALKQLAQANQEEITKLRPEAELLNLMRKTLRESFRNIPLPYPLRNKPGVVAVSCGDFEISVNGIACVVRYELGGSSYKVDFKLVPVPNINEKTAEDFYPGNSFDVWVLPKRRKSKSRSQNT